MDDVIVKLPPCENVDIPSRFEALKPSVKQSQVAPILIS